MRTEVGITVIGEGKVTGGKERNGDKHRRNDGVCWSWGTVIQRLWHMG